MSLLINGVWQPGTGPTFSRHSPQDGSLVFTGASASAEDVDLAFKAARGAFAEWANLDVSVRAAICRRFAELLTAHTEALSAIIAQEIGKTRWEARTEVATMVGKIELSIKAQQERTGQKHIEQAFGQFALRHKPHGVVAVFGPYNFPGHLPNGHIVPALLAGNTVVFKPSELAPKTAEATVQLWQAAGLPPGVMNLLQGERETGAAVSAHPELDGLFFTGSSRTGSLLNRQFADKPQVILALEMGGNNSLVIGQVANRRAAVHEIIHSAFITSGQRCTCARKLFVAHGGDGDQLLRDLVTASQVLKVGRWTDDPEPFMGPVISPQAAQQLLASQARLLSLGATALLPMRLLADGPAFLQPGILDVTAIHAQMPDEEDFGPLLKVIRYQHLDDAIGIANSSRYGLSAGLFSDSTEQYQHFLRHIRAGIINWNKPTTGASGAFPFGGMGLSGNHRPSAYYAADYCAYPVASTESTALSLPATLAPGLTL